MFYYRFMSFLRQKNITWYHRSLCMRKRIEQYKENRNILAELVLYEDEIIAKKVRMGRKPF